MLSLFSLPLWFATGRRETESGETPLLQAGKLIQLGEMKNFQPELINFAYETGSRKKPISRNKVLFWIFYSVAE